MSTDEERIRHLAGDGVPDDALADDERAELDAVRALLGDPTLWDEPAPDLGDRVVAAVAAERGAGAGPITALPSPASPRGRRSSRRAPVLAFLAGAAAAAAIALAVALIPGRGPAGVQIALAGTTLAPEASGSARVSEHESGLRIELNASGLPRRDGRLFYQAWLKGDSGLVPIGTFHTGDHVVLWAGVALRDFPTITVTQEEVGNQDSSGLRVLTGTLSP